MLSRVLLLLLMLTPPAFAQNGDDRGGGDPSGAEVYSIARGVSAKLEAWVNDGTIKLSQEQVKKIKDLTRCAFSEKPTTCLFVNPLDRVYRYPEKAPSPEAEEETLINIAKHQPPEIDVGIVRWKLLEGDPLTKEMMVLHELIGAAGIIQNGERLDEQFYISYQLKNKNLEAWAKYKDQFNGAILKIYNFNMGALHLDVSHMATFAETFELTDTYKKIMHPENYIKGKKKIHDYQIDAYNEFVEMVQEGFRTTFAGPAFVGKNMQAGSDYYKDEANKVIHDYSKSIEYSDPAWKNWSISILNEYIAGYIKILGVFAQDTANGEIIKAYLLSNCPDPYTGAPDKLTACELEAMKTGLQENANKTAVIHQQELGIVLEATMGKVTTTINPAASN